MSQTTERAAGAVVDDFATDLVRTTVTALGDGSYQWLRTPGPLAPPPSAGVDASSAAVLAEVGTHEGCRLAVGRPQGTGWTYHLGGAHSVATRLLREGPQEDLIGPLRGLGALLRALHDTAPPASLANTTAPPLARLGPWLRCRSPIAHAAQAEALLKSSVGEGRWQRFTDWFWQLDHDEDRVLAHGGPGLSSLVVDEGSGTAELLIGDGVCTAPRTFELGWIVGELLLFRWLVGDDDPVWSKLLEALTTGYGQDVGEQWRWVAALRAAAHVHDFSAYVALDRAEIRRMATFLGFLLDV